MSRVTSRRRLLLAAIALSAFGSAGRQGRAQAWPTKPIRVIVPLTAGSATDVMARLVMDQVSARLAQPIIVENGRGAGNTIGMSAVAKADPDGPHHPRQFFDAHRDVGDPLESGLRDDGSRRHRSARQHACGHGGQPRQGLQDAHRLRGGGKGEARHGQLSLGRRGKFLPSTASGSDWQPDLRRCICRSRGRRKR